jgi:HAE1 family hydrophobic/amphiphilic exporter-1
LEALPEVERFTTQVTGTFANIRVSFPDELENTAVPPAIKEQMVAYSLGFSGAEVRVYGFGPSFYGGGGSPPNYSIKVLGYNYEQVRDIAEDLGSRLKRMSRIQDVDTNASGNWFQSDRASEFVVEIDRGALARYDMTVQDFVGRMNAVIRGQTGQSLLKLGGEEVRFDVKVEGFQTVDLTELQETIITGTSGTGIRIGDVVTISPKEILARIRRENQQYERTVAYEFRGPTKLGDLVRDAVIEATVLPPGYTIEEADTWRWSAEEREQIYFVLAISILLIYMVTAALFESMVQPLCVLLTVPMALIGVFLMFFYANATFTREAYIGVIMMGGIVVNNAILLIDHINQIRRDAGLSLRDSILKGTLERVRPILMTTTTTVLGLLPLVIFSQGADSNIWNALAYALIGGLLSSTIFVLTTTPALYYLFEGGWRRL